MRGGQKVNPSFGLFHFLVSRMAFFLRLYVCVCVCMCASDSGFALERDEPSQVVETAKGMLNQ